MSRTTLLSPPTERIVTNTGSTDEGDMDTDSEVDFVLNHEPEKDEAEQELEKLVFGDTTGVIDNIKGFSLEQELDTDLDGLDDQTGLAGLDNADLFFTDVEPSATLLPSTKSLQHSHSTRAAVWEDSDDERMIVSLASVPRLRKLRQTAEEDVVDGREYSLRLRQQFELLNPTPDWATLARSGPARKKRRLSGREDTSDEAMSDVSSGSDPEDVSAPPLEVLLRDASSIIRPKELGRGRRRKIKPEVIQIRRIADIGTTQPSSITSLSFHPSYPLLLSSGPSSTLYLHQIAPSPPAPAANPLLISLHIRNTPLTTTAFHPTDSRIFLSARRKFFHIWDLDSGQVEKVTQVVGQKHEQKTMERFKLSPDGQHVAVLGSARKGGGVLNVLSATTSQWQMQVRVESRGGVADFCWWRDGTGLTIAAKNGEVTEWSVREQRVVARWQDDGAVGTTVLALGGQHELVKSAVGTDRWVAIGSSSGIVNIYDRRALLQSQPAGAELPLPVAPKPYKILDHLTTPTSYLAFSMDGQLLAMASHWKRDALRLVHLPSATVFKNWPTSSTPLGRITAVAFADGNTIGDDVHSLLAVANEQGKIRAWEII